MIDVSGDVPIDSYYISRESHYFNCSFILFIYLFFIPITVKLLN